MFLAWQQATGVGRKAVALAETDNGRNCRLQLLLGQFERGLRLAEAKWSSVALRYMPRHEVLVCGQGFEPF